MEQNTVNELLVTAMQMLSETVEIHDESQYESLEHSNEWVDHIKAIRLFMDKSEIHQFHDIMLGITGEPITTMIPQSTDVPKRIPINIFTDLAEKCDLTVDNLRYNQGEIRDLLNTLEVQSTDKDFWMVAYIKLKLKEYIMGENEVINDLEAYTFDREQELANNVNK